MDRGHEAARFPYTEEEETLPNDRNAQARDQMQLQEQTPRPQSMSATRVLPEESSASSRHTTLMPASSGTTEPSDRNAQARNQMQLQEQTPRPQSMSATRLLPEVSSASSSHPTSMPTSSRTTEHSDRNAQARHQMQLQEQTPRPQSMSATRVLPEESSASSSHPTSMPASSEATEPRSPREHPVDINENRLPRDQFPWPNLRGTREEQLERFWQLRARDFGLRRNDEEEREILRQIEHLEAVVRHHYGNGLNAHYQTQCTIV